MEKKQKRNNMEVANNMTIENKLTRILNLFFGMNPRNKFWLLEVLLLAKRGELVICNNKIEADDYILCVVDTSILAVTGGTEKTLQNWEVKGIKAQYAVGRTNAEIKKLFSEIDNTFSERGQGQNNIFATKQMEPLDLMEIIHILCTLPDDWFQSGVGIFTEEVLSFIARNEGNAEGMFFQPIQITRLMTRLLEATDGAVYNPYAGLASYGTFLNDKVDYYAQEISQMYLIARLNLLLHGKDESRCVQGNSMTEWYDQPFDYIIATPPFNARISERRKDTMEADFFSRAYNQALKKVAAIVSGYFCAATGGLSFAIRKTLVEKDLVEYVIKLPNNLFFETNIPAFVVVLNREKKYKGQVVFIDASECFKKQGVKNVLDESMVISLLNSEDKHHSAIIDNSIIFAHNCSLIPEGYIERRLIELKEGEPYINLEHILTPCSRQSVELNNGEHQIVIFPFTDLQFSVKTSELAKKNVNTHVPACIIEDDCIIIDTRRQLRSVYITVDDTPAYYMPYYQAFKVDTSIVIPEYLVMQLRQPYMAKQIVVENLVSQSVSQEFKIAKVLVPSLEEQKEAIIRYKEQLLQEMGMQFKDIFDKMKSEYMIEVRNRKHDMKTPMTQLRNTLTLLEAFANKLPEEFSSQLHNYVSRQKVALDTLSEIVRHLADEDVFSEPEVLELETVLSSFVCKNEKYSIVYVPDSLAINEAVGKGKAKVYIGKSDLLRLINNIIGNAVEHGFVENKTNYELLITLSTEGDSYLIDFTNNGKPLPEGMDKARYGMKGVKGKDSEGQGTGGYVVKSIVEHYGGDYDIIKREWAGRILTDVIIKLPIYRGDE